MLIPNAFSIHSAISGDKSALPFSNFEIVGRVTRVTTDGTLCLS